MCAIPYFWLAPGGGGGEIETGTGLVTAKRARMSQMRRRGLSALEVRKRWDCDGRNVNEVIDGVGPDGPEFAASVAVVEVELDCRRTVAGSRYEGVNDLYGLSSRGRTAGGTGRSAVKTEDLEQRKSQSWTRPSRPHVARIDSLEGWNATCLGVAVWPSASTCKVCCVRTSITMASLSPATEARWLSSDEKARSIIALP